MSRTLVLVVAMLVGQTAQAADLGMHRRIHHHHAKRWAARYVERNNVIHCTTGSFFGLFTSSSCGQGFDPLASATN